jgi:23S rRNA (guanosine2251-2'-O)-methyltransferase
MSGNGGNGRGKRGAKPGPGSRAKSGKPRPGTGGYGKRKLEGKGPTPAAEFRPGHPAQRRAAAAAKTADAVGRPSTRRPADQPVARSAQAGIAGGSGSSGSGAVGVRAIPGWQSPGRQSPRGSGVSPRASTAGGSRSSGYGPSGYGSSGDRAPGSTAEVVAGRNAVLESLRASVPALALHVGPRLDADDRITEAIKLAADRGIAVVEAGRSELDRLTGGAVHQGLALRIRQYAYAHAQDLLGERQSLIVALDGITDPRNLGAVARSVAAFGGSGVLIPVRRSAGVTAGAWKASAGALARVRVAQTPNMARALAEYAQSGLFVVGLDANADDDIGSLTLADGPLVLVIGSEGKGLSRLVAQRCDLLVRIPISGAESLNAGVAAGIALYQVSALRAAASATPRPGAPPS